MNPVLNLTPTKMPYLDISMQFIEGTLVQQQAALSITEIAFSIFSSSLLEPTDLYRVGLVCKRWKAMFSLEAFQALIKKAIRSFDYKKVTLEQIELLMKLSPQTTLQVSKLLRNELTAQEVDQFFKQMDFLKPQQWNYQSLQVPFIGNFIHQALPADNDLSLTQVCVHILPRLEHQQFKEALLTVALEKISPETAVDTPENQILLQKGIQTLGENTPNRIETWIAHHMPSLATTRLQANPHVGLYGIKYQSTDYWALNLFIVAAATNASLYPYYKGHVASIRAREMDIHLLFEEHCTRILTQEQIQMEANRIMNACRLLLTDK